MVFVVPFCDWRRTLITHVISQVRSIHKVRMQIELGPCIGSRFVIKYFIFSRKANRKGSKCELVWRAIHHKQRVDIAPCLQSILFVETARRRQVSKYHDAQKSKVTANMLDNVIRRFPRGRELEGLECHPEASADFLRGAAYSSSTHGIAHQYTRQGLSTLTRHQINHERSCQLSSAHSLDGTTHATRSVSIGSH